jgi:uncharacterized membrane protein
MLAFCVACAYPAVTSPPPSPAASERYQARGNEPGWSLTISDSRIDFVGSYGDKKISVARPDPRPSFNGRRYVTDRLTVDITYSRCNDAMSGGGFEPPDMFMAEGSTVTGCGGARRPDWDV